MATIKTKVALFRELLALKEVIDVGQIQAAAERNGIKHSNLSKMIADLEAKFKTSLLIRSSAGSVPTNATRQLYSDIEVISQALDNLLENLTAPEELTGFFVCLDRRGLCQLRYVDRIIKVLCQVSKTASGYSNKLSYEYVQPGYYNN